MTKDEFYELINNQYFIKEYFDEEVENPKIKNIYLQQQQSKYRVSFYELGDNDNKVFIILHLVNSFNSQTKFKLSPNQFFELFTKQTLF